MGAEASDRHRSGQGLAGRALFGRPGGLILAVAGAALIVWLVDRQRAA